VPRVTDPQRSFGVFEGIGPFDIIGTIIFGAIIGVLARIVIPGKQTYGWIVTVLLGIAGALIGYWVWGLLGGSNTFGLDWIRWVISVAGAAILSFGYTAITRKGKSETGTTT
jgi:uncharacterized membrane protein YeaQ/YmgE (transglycosylase-associated protein family)